ncbi:MAG TPA: polysaccharide lyase family protein [Verrucomicrobiae bacterium]|nr:polysaccharide lyase family protein [Verrucomicrobiae bacterium]
MPIFANNPGGFTTLVNKPVTTGTESFGGRTDHFLDNGILHVAIASNGNVDSIKYLKPGLSGTPKANGIEMVSQSGVNFGNHKAIYYYWYPDGNGDAVFSGVAVSSTNIDLSYLRAYNPAVHQVAADMELHYMLGKGNTALYAYLIARHPASFSNYNTDLNISFIQCIWPTAHDNTNFLCENQYLDDNVKYGMFLNGVQQTRNGLQPNFWDDYHSIAVPGMPKEVTQYTTGAFAGCTNGKYSYTFDYPTLGTWGMASDINKVGLWVITGAHEYQNNGPTACEYAGGYGGLVLFEPLIAHYGNTGLSVSSNADWTKIYGPWMFYFNSESNGVACWKDSQNQVLAEENAWPYSWLTNAVYEADDRATVSGRLIINDPLRPEANAAGAWIGLAAPDSGLENDPDNWQRQSDGYQFWTRANADGTFTIPNVRASSPYGGTAIYQLYAFCSGTNGSVGEYSHGPFSFAPDTSTNLGTLVWNVPHHGNSVAWEIGIPNRTAAEFRHGDEYGRPGLWLNFANEFPNPTTYIIGQSNWTNDWNYVQGAYWAGATPNNMIWNIQFNLPALPNSGNATLNIAWAGAYSAAIQVFVNDPDRSGAVFKDFYPSVPAGANSLLREGIHDKYAVDHVSIPVSKLVRGTNTITLIQRRAVTATSSYVMYDYLDFELPTAGVPENLSAIAGDSKVNLNWPASSGATSYKVKRATAGSGVFAVIATPTSTNYTDATAVNGTVYYYVVSSVNPNGESADSESVSARPAATTPPRLDYTLSGSELKFAWPHDHIGWRLEAQTNSLDAGLGSNWFTISGAVGTNQMTIPIGAFGGTVFFRLAFP